MWVFERLSTFMLVSCPLMTESTNTLAAIHEAIVNPRKGLVTFVDLRAGVMVREIGHALPQITSNGAADVAIVTILSVTSTSRCQATFRYRVPIAGALNLDAMSAAREMRASLGLRAGDAMGSMTSHLASVDKQMSVIETRFGVGLQEVRHETTSTILRNGQDTDREPVTCEEMKRLRDRYMEVVEQKSATKNKPKGRQTRADADYTWWDGVLDVRVARPADGLWVESAVQVGAAEAEVDQIVGVLRLVASYLHTCLRNVTPGIAALLRRDLKKARRRQSKARKAGRAARLAAGDGLIVATAKVKVRKATKPEESAEAKAAAKEKKAAAKEKKAAEKAENKTIGAAVKLLLADLKKQIVDQDKAERMQQAAALKQLKSCAAPGPRAAARKRKQPDGTPRENSRAPKRMLPSSGFESVD